MQLINDDCLNVLKTLKQESIDLILCDLPYGQTPCDWDKQISFDEMWKQVNHIIKFTSSIIFFGTEPFSSKLRLSNPEMYKYDFKWIKNKSLGANFCHAKNSPIKIIEDIIIFSKAKINHIGKTINRMNYFPQNLIECNQIERKTYSTKINSFKKNINRESHKNYIRTLTNYPTNILKYDFTYDERKNRFHPTQKPIHLLEYLVKTYTAENETVLDFCMGSGSTGIACLNSNRNFIGIEKEKEYFEIAKKRIEYYGKK